MLQLEFTVRDPFGVSQVPFKMRRGEKMNTVFVYLRTQDGVYYTWPYNWTEVSLTFPGTTVTKTTANATLNTNYNAGWVYFDISSADLEALKLGENDAKLTITTPTWIGMAILKKFITIEAAA